MWIQMLKAKVHRATVTEANLHYDGSCAIDRDLLNRSGIRPFERIEIYNISNGERLSTYAIEAPAASGVISMNGAAARRAAPGDLVIICAYANYDAIEAENHQPDLVYVDGNNRIVDRGAQPKAA